MIRFNLRPGWFNNQLLIMWVKHQPMIFAELVVPASIVPSHRYYSREASNFGARGSSSNQVSAAFVLPLGGKLNKNCTKVSNQIVKEQEDYILFQSFNHQYEMASRCTALLKSGATINQEVFPELAQMCSGISVAKGLSGDEQPLTPEKSAALTIPKPSPSIESTY